MESNIRCFEAGQFDLPLNTEEIRIIIKTMQKDFSVPTANVSIICLDRESLRAMKKKYFDRDRYTDVISFPLETAGDLLEGEIYISPQDIQINSAEYSVSFRNETARIIIHGMLHLLGYDDIKAEDKEEMSAMEDKYLKDLTF